MNSEIKKAIEKYETAARQLVEIIQKGYPAESIVRVTTNISAGEQEHKICVLHPGSCKSIACTEDEQ